MQAVMSRHKDGAMVSLGERGSLTLSCDGEAWRAEAVYRPNGAHAAPVEVTGRSDNPVGAVYMALGGIMRKEDARRVALVALDRLGLDPALPGLPDLRPIKRNRADRGMLPGMA